MFRAITHISSIALCFIITLFFVPQCGLCNPAYRDPSYPATVYPYGYVTKSSVAFSPDGKILATSGRDHTVSLWNPDTGEELQALVGHSDDVLAVAFSPDGKQIASGSGDTTIRIWDATTGKELHCLKAHTKAINSVAFSPDGKEVASASSDTTIKVWSVTTGKELRTLAGHSLAVNSISYTPGGKTIASASDDRTIKIWDAAAGKELRTLPGHSDKAVCLAVGPDGTILSCDRNTAKLWDGTTGKELRSVLYENNLRGTPGRAVAFSPDGKLFASSGSWSGTSVGNSVKLWETATGMPGKVPTKSISVSAALLDHNKIAVVHRDESTIESAVPCLIMPGFRLITSIAFSPDGKTLAVGSGNYTIRIYETATGKTLHTLGGQASITTVVFSPDGKTIASGAGDGTINLWDAKTGRELHSFQQSNITNGLSGVSSLVFCPDGKTIVSNGGERMPEEPVTHHMIKIWNVATGDALAVFDAYSYHQQVVLSPDGKIIAVGGATKQTYRTTGPGGRDRVVDESKDQSIKRWNAVTGKELPSWPYPKSFANALAFSPDGAILATGDFNQKTIRLWNTVTGELIRILPEFANYGLAFSPDGKTLAAGGIPGTSDQITLWKVSDGTKVLALEDIGCYSLAFNGKVLASAGPTYQDHKAKRISSGPTVWDLSTGKTLLIEAVRADSNSNPGSRCVALSPDGNTLAYDDGPFIERWDLRTGKLLPSFTESAVLSKK